MRMCIVLREKLPRQLMFRVVRTRDDKTGKATVELATPDKPRNGRSAYISKDPAAVENALKKNRIAKALRCRVPQDTQRDLQQVAQLWHRLQNDEKGLLYCEAYGLDGVPTPVEQIQQAAQCAAHDTIAYNNE